MSEKKPKFYVYMLYCGDGSIYTGYTTDLMRRYQEHSEGKGAKYTSSHLPVYLIYHEVFKDKSSAMKREYEIKHTLNHEQKVALAKSALNRYMETQYGDKTVDMTAENLVILPYKNHGVNGIRYVINKDDLKVNLSRCQNPKCPYCGTYVDDLNNGPQKGILVK